MLTFLHKDDSIAVDAVLGVTTSINGVAFSRTVTGVADK